ncbi:IS1634 family transposase [Sulfurovum sp.]|uniref:IS1634 family transposase n=1 Tax=Sulfurovum sp. TaxID=1969726 RepID=UPI0025FCD6D4|nr:IS1634 family transposase [Sulfurovum sp.]
MFVRIKKSGKYQYLQIVQTYREGKKVKQQVISTLGRLDRLQQRGDIESITRSLSKYSEDVLMVLTRRNDLRSDALKIGPVLVFKRLWQETGLSEIFRELLSERKYEFDVELSVFITVLHRLFVSGSDRSCEKWMTGYRIKGSENLSLHHFYQAMAFLGSPIEDQTGKTPFAPRCIKDLIEEKLFARRRTLFTELEIVFFDTTSLYFEGEGGDQIGAYGNSKDHRPDLKQMVVGAVLDNQGFPLFSEMWPGNTADVTTLLPIARRLKKRFGVEKICVVADRGMISQGTIKELEANGFGYILGVRMRRVKDVKKEVLARAGKYKEVNAEDKSSKAPSPLKVKQVWHKRKRYIVCVNTKQARKDAADRDAIIQGLEDKLKKGVKSLVGNKGYRRYLKAGKESLQIDRDKIKQEERFDGKWVLTTNMDLPSDQIALKYKELWMVEHVFRQVKSILETRPIYHKQDETIRGHVFCSFLALVLRKELDMRLEKSGLNLEWFDIKQDLKNLQEITIDDAGQKVILRTEAKGTCSSVFQAVGMTLPPTIRKPEPMKM